VRRLVLASLLLVLATAPARAAASPTPAPTPAAKATPAPAPSPAVRTFLGLPTGNRAIALGLSLAVNGLGQFYNGDAEKGRLMMAPLLVFPVAYGFDALTGGAYMRIFAYAINLSIKPWSMWDAYQHAVPPAPSPTPFTRPSPTPMPSPTH
jgi:hypothetical protein